MREEILKLLTAKSQYLTDSGGGNPLITPQDLAYILGTIKHPNASDYGKFKYAGQTSRLPDLTERLFNVADKELTWIAPRPDFFQDLCELALVESIAENICFTCQGSGGIVLNENHMAALNQNPRQVQKFRTGQKIDCTQCRGSGHKPPTDAHRAAILGIPNRSMNIWGERYRDVQRLVDRWDGILISALYKRLEYV